MTKYRAKPTFVDGIRFASKHEASRYIELRLLYQAREIVNLTLQPRFQLKVGDVVIGHYRADFQYFDKRKGCVIIEDSKGYRTDLYRWKKKHFEAQYGREILET